MRPQASQTTELDKTEATFIDLAAPYEEDLTVARLLARSKAKG